MMNKWIMGLGLTLLVSAGAYAQDTTRMMQDTMKRKTAEQKVDNTAATVGNAAEKGTRAVGEAAVVTGRAVGKAGKATGKAVGNAAKATARGAKKAAQATKRALNGENKSDSLTTPAKRDSL